MANTKLHFARFEFKYLLSPKLRAELERELRYFLEFDPYVEAQPDHQYFVRSLYFDDPSYSAFYDKVDGLHTRSKFRLRTYTRNVGDNTPQFLENKGRYNNLVLKHRVALNAAELDDQVRSDALITKLMPLIPPSSVGQKFEYELFRKQLRPVALVDYLRRPYISRFDPEFRLTFDSELEATMTRALFPTPQERRRKLLPGYTVMEVKFRRTIPSWFHRLIQAYELRRVSISKICHAMEALELAHDPN
ncbi:MAG: polyphosphate polymerase domain-containing protein [Desulfuromonadales bacterium]|nr:polyphosphate polymerase domain-containing protein [Desulfuromonadales bacterium]